MADLRVLAFLEDLMQEALIRSLTLRVAVDAGMHPRTLRFDTRNATGGRPSALRQLRMFVERLAGGDEARPDLLIVAIDSDCSSETRQDIASILRPLDGRVCIAIAVPDPYIERWYMLDPDAVRKALGNGPALPATRTCDKGFYKTALKIAIRSAGGVPTLGGYEYADQIVPELDLYRCGQDDPAFERFVVALRGCIAEYQRIA